MIKKHLCFWLDHVTRKASSFHGTRTGSLPHLPSDTQDSGNKSEEVTPMIVATDEALSKQCSSVN